MSSSWAEAHEMIMHVRRSVGDTCSIHAAARGVGLLFCQIAIALCRDGIVRSLERLSRREGRVRGVSSLVAVASIEDAAAMRTTTIDITTPHGACETRLCFPDGPAPRPAVIVCFDAFGVRPSMIEIATRIVGLGYVAVLPDLYYRVGSPFVLKPELAGDDAKPMFALFGDEKLRGEFMTRWLGPTLAYDHLRETVGPLLEALEAHPSVAGGIGTTGYCLGGNISLRLATIFGERIRATASFHGGSLVTPREDSPHKRLASVQSSVYVAGAIEDGTFPDEAKATLIAALQAAGVKHTVETYPGRHGFAVRDNPAYDEACAERHYTAMATLFGGTLKA